MTPKRPVYPFAALMGQERLKLALVLNAINPLLGGVLIRGEKGTAKSTAARGLAELLPPIAMVAGCRFHCHPELPELMCVACRKRAAQGEVLPRRDRPPGLPAGAEPHPGGPVPFSPEPESPGGGGPHYLGPGEDRDPVRARPRRQEAILPYRTIDNYRRLSYRINTPHPPAGIVAPVS